MKVVNKVGIRPVHASRLSNFIDVSGGTVRESWAVALAVVWLTRDGQQHRGCSCGKTGFIEPVNNIQASTYVYGAVGRISRSGKVPNIILSR